MNKRIRRKFFDGLFDFAGAPFITAILRILAITNRLRCENRETYDCALDSGRPVIFAFWHEDMIATALAYLRMKPGLLAVMVSRSRDGEKLACVLRGLGAETVRGSSSRGAMAGVIEMCRYLSGPMKVARNGHAAHSPMAAMALDGPRGPRREAKPGVALLARKTGALVLPVAFAHSRQIAFRSWDRTRLPLPFSSSRLRFGALLDGKEFFSDDYAFVSILQERLNGLHEDLLNKSREASKNVHCHRVG